VVIPTYQEAHNIESVLAALAEADPELRALVVDDGSPDGTADLAQAVGDRTGTVRVLRRSEKSGLGSAYRAGFQWGISRGHDALVEMDADLSHDPADVPRLLAALEGDVDLAIGSRYVKGGRIPHWTLRRRLLSRWGNRYAGAMLGLGILDATSGLRAYRASFLDGIDLAGVRTDGYGFQIEMADRVVAGGGRVVEIPISFTDRVLGDSKMSQRIVVEALGMVTRRSLERRILRRPAPDGLGPVVGARPAEDACDRAGSVDSDTNSDSSRRLA